MSPTYCYSESIFYDETMSYEIALFDLDYTLFDSKRSEAEAIRESLAECSIGDIPEMLTTYQLINKGLWEKLENGDISLEKLRVHRFELLLEKFAINLDARILADAYTRNLGIFGGLLPGALDLLQSLDNRLKLGLVTNGVSHTQRARLKNFDIAKYFQAIVISGEFGNPKPSPAMFSEALRVLGYTEKASVIMVGDSLTSDMRGAANFGIDSCWYNPEQALNPTGLPVTHVATSFKEIFRILTGGN